MGEHTRQEEVCHAAVRGTHPESVPLFTQWYGMKEFAIADLDGYVLTFAERAS